MTDLTRSSTDYKFSLELNDLLVLSCGAITPTRSSLAHLSLQPLQLLNRMKMMINTWSQMAHKHNSITKMRRWNSLGLC